MSISRPRHPVIAIVGASGGLGASTLAAATALSAADRAAVLVEGEPRRVGLDVTVGVEHLPGLRWPDLSAHEGPVAPSLRQDLPAARVPVLAGGPGAAPSPTVAARVVRALADEGPVVLDLPPDLLSHPAWAEVPDVIVLVAGLRPRWLRDAEVVAGACADQSDRVVLVTRGGARPGRVPERVAARLGVALLEHLPDDPGVVTDEGRGRAPGRRGSTARVARAVLEIARPQLPGSIGAVAA